MWEVKARFEIRLYSRKKSKYDYLLFYIISLLLFTFIILFNYWSYLHRGIFFGTGLKSLCSPTLKIKAIPASECNSE